MDDERTRSKPVLAQLVALWDQHAGRYNGVLYRAALVKNGEAWQSAVVWLCPRQKSDAKDDGYRADYGNLLIVRGSFSLADARAVLEGIVERGLINLPESPSVPMTVIWTSTWLDGGAAKTVVSTPLRRLRIPISDFGHRATGQCATRLGLGPWPAPLCSCIRRHRASVGYSGRKPGDP